MEAIENMENEVGYEETEETESKGSSAGWVLLVATGVGAGLALLGKKYVYEPIKAKIAARREAKEINEVVVVPFSNGESKKVK